jgi:hypothetical protein
LQCGSLIDYLFRCAGRRIKIPDYAQVVIFERKMPFANDLMREVEWTIVLDW